MKHISLREGRSWQIKPSTRSLLDQVQIMEGHRCPLVVSRSHRINFRLSCHLSSSIQCRRPPAIIREHQNNIIIKKHLLMDQVTSSIAIRTKKKVDRHKPRMPRSNMPLSCNSKSPWNSSRSQMLQEEFHQPEEQDQHQLSQQLQAILNLIIPQLLNSRPTMTTQSSKRYYSGNVTSIGESLCSRWTWAMQQRPQEHGRWSLPEESSSGHHLHHSLNTEANSATKAPSHSSRCHLH